ncbi:uncharacterized protein [Panulirus ornatus]|uniref:uncharacterized protein isoform X2 n=1 Tax=Panulirus ornatus TaxID=150431 RepID=UPI003A8B77CC
MVAVMDQVLWSGPLAPADPFWYFENQLNIPVTVDNVDTTELVTAVVFVVRAIFTLTNVFDPNPAAGRSVGEDQVGVFRQLEASLKTVGLDGRACLLKLVCEAQKPKLLKLNLLGHLLAALLTPRDETLLAEYAEAAALGRQDSCAPHYPSCPISIFNIFNFAKTNKTSKTTTASKIPTTSDVKNPEDSQV